MFKFHPPLFAICLILLTTYSLHAQDFYGSGVQEVRIELPYKSWEFKLDSLKSNNPEARLLGFATVNGERFDSVGVRYKGNSSFFRTRKETSRKLPFNVKLDFKKKSQTMKSGHGTVKLSNAFLDPTFIREPLAYEVIRTYMPAPLCNFSRLYVNNDFFGVYISSESIDERFIKKHFGTETGDIVKCDPDNWKRVKSQSGCPKGENASLTYLNDNIGCYDAFYEVDDARAWKPLLNLIKILNKTPEKIETVLDVDQTLWMLALNNILVNLDSYNGSLSHNYYLWFDTLGVAHPLIWDLNMSFGGWRRNFSFEEMKDNELIEYQPLAEITNSRRPLISKLLRVSMYRKIYLAHYRTILDEWLLSGLLMQRADVWRKEVEPWVKKDELRLYPLEDFNNGMEKTLTYGPDHLIGVKTLMTQRTTWLDKHPLLNKPQPTIETVKHAKDGEKLKVTAKITDASKGAWLYYRKDKMFAFSRVPLHDDGANGDTGAGDGTYAAELKLSEVVHYYVVAEGEEGASTLPKKASFEFFSVDK
ncbi:MAG: CotH kinase family protein [Lewinellaceae bacterium]|nr:CotH kinase family protein [Saprospiraceae bacterium]MCB9342390.1 CotH kinase family protein [Lewinellaceae bacterium]